MYYLKTLRHTPHRRWCQPHHQGPWVPIHHCHRWRWDSSTRAAKVKALGAWHDQQPLTSSRQPTSKQSVFSLCKTGRMLAREQVLSLRLLATVPSTATGYIRNSFPDGRHETSDLSSSWGEPQLCLTITTHVTSCHSYHSYQQGGAQNLPYLM
jgi:hypothetical protein